ncbi:MAG TPA: hypothetical protein VGI06_07895, partial [Acidimicrobiales bacterium]
MARIPLVDPGSDDADPAARAALEQLLPGGVQPNVYRAIANHPGALDAFAGFGSARPGCRRSTTRPTPPSPPISIPS